MLYAEIYLNYVYSSINLIFMVLFIHLIFSIWFAILGKPKIIAKN